MRITSLIQEGREFEMYDGVPLAAQNKNKEAMKVTAKNTSKFALNDQLAYCIAGSMHKSSPSAMKLWTPTHADDRHYRDQVYSKRDMRLKFVKNIPNKKKTYTLCISPVITKRGNLDTQFLLVFHN